MCVEQPPEETSNLAMLVGALIILIAITMLVISLTACGIVKEQDISNAMHGKVHIEMQDDLIVDTDKKDAK